MKLYRSILDKLLDLNSLDNQALRNLLDEVGLEVKSIEERTDDIVFTIETLANRGDHLSALGIARELSAKLLMKPKSLSLADLDDRRISTVVKNETPQTCYRYALLELHITPQFKLPSYIVSVLQSNQEKHPIVDILNYTALEMGQPMHAFDRDKIEGEVIVALTSAEETIDALDGKKYKVPANSIVIKDRKKILAVAGVIGCSNSMVTKETTKVLIESASFDPIHVRKTAKAMGISTDASHSFERGCDFENVLPALRRVIYLTQDGSSASAQAVGHTLIQSSADQEPYKADKITVRVSELKSQINSPRLDMNEVTARLKYLGYGVDYQDKAKEFAVTVPSFRRWDVFHEQDIIEEFSRSHGLMSIKQVMPELDYQTPEYNPQDTLIKKIEPVLVGNGFIEVITKSFYSNDDLNFVEQLDSKNKDQHVRLKNSIETAYAALKTNNILSLVSLVSANVKRNVTSIKVFEFGKIFNQVGGQVNEIETLSLAVSGRWFEGEWQKSPETKELFFFLKGVVTNLGRALNVDLKFGEHSQKDSFFHPGMQAAIFDGKKQIGTIGIVHPSILQKYECKQDIIAVNLLAQPLMQADKLAAFIEPNDLPSIRRDLTLAVPLQELAGDVINLLEKKNIPSLVQSLLIDEFKKPEEDFRRVTYRFTFQDQQKTLEHGFVDEQMQSIISTLQDKLKLKVVA